jgi:TonB family protein
VAFDGKTLMPRHLLLSGLALLGSAAMPPPSVAATPVAWTASGKWQAKFERTQCMAERNFTSPKGVATVALQLEPTSDHYTLLVQWPGTYAGMDTEEGRILAGSESVDKNHFVMEPSALKGRRIHRTSLSAETFAKLDQARQITIQSPSLRGTFPLTSLAALKATLDDCRALILEQWGFSKDKQALLAAFPKPRDDVRRYISHKIYPESAVNAGAVGTVVVVTNVGVDGRASGCTLIRSSGHDPLDRATCGALTERVRFKPASTKSGEPLAAPYQMTFVYLIR